MSRGRGTWRKIDEQRSKRLVIDTSVLRAAGLEDATDPGARRCTHLLMGVLWVCHKCVVGAEMRAEWARRVVPCNPTGAHWAVEMVRIRKHLPPRSDTRKRDLRDSIKAAIGPERYSNVAEKDLHLVEAALVEDRIVVSVERQAREAFAAAAQKVPQLKCIAWVDPSAWGLDALKEWLEAGADPRDQDLLGGGSRPTHRATRARN